MADDPIQALRHLEVPSQQPIALSSWIQECENSCFRSARHQIMQLCLLEWVGGLLQDSELEVV